MKNHFTITLSFMLLSVLGISQTYTNISVLEETSVQEATLVIPNGVITNPDFGFFEPFDISSAFTGSYLITASEMQDAGFVNGDQIVSVGWELIQGQEIVTTGTLSLNLLNTTNSNAILIAPSDLNEHSVTIPNQSGLVKMEFEYPFNYMGSGVYVIYKFIPDNFSSFGNLPTVGVNNSLNNGNIIRFMVSSNEIQFGLHEEMNSYRPVTLLGKVDCPFLDVAFINHTDTTATISWNGPGTYEIEYGETPYIQGTGGITLPLFTTASDNNELTITDLTPGKTYNVYVRKICEETTSYWIPKLMVGTSISGIVTEFPYEENFDNKLFLYNTGWFVFPANTISFFDWRLVIDSQYDFDYGFINPVYSHLSLSDWRQDFVNSTIYTRPIYFDAEQTYTMSLDYKHFWHTDYYEDSENYPNLNLFLSSETSDNNTILLSNINNISNYEYENITIEFSPDVSGIYYIGMEGVFLPNPTQTDDLPLNTVNLNHLYIDNFKLQSSQLSLNNINKQIKISQFPNPFDGEFILKSEISFIDKVEVYDIKGVLIFEKYCQENYIKINLEGLKTGVYIVRVTSEDSVMFKKIIKK